MNKTQLIAAIAEETNLTKVDVKKAIDAFISISSGALKSGNQISLMGFGAFSVSKRISRNGRNPKTGEKIMIAEKKFVKFKTSEVLVEQI